MNTKILTADGRRFTQINGFAEDLGEKATSRASGLQLCDPETNSADSLFILHPICVNLRSSAVKIVLPLRLSVFA